MAGLRAEDLASRLGVSYSTVRNWEKDRTEPSLGHVSDVARVTGADLLWLIDGREAACH